MGCFLPHFLEAQFVQYFYFFLRPSRGLEAQLRFNLCATDALSDLRSEATVLPIFLKFHGVCFVPYCLLHISCVLTTLQLTFGWNLPAEVRLTISHRRAGRALQEHSVQTPSRLGLKGICDC